MIKKIAAIVGAGALLLSVAGPALARVNQGGCVCRWPNLFCACRDENTAVVTNGASAMALTGGNSQGDYAEVNGCGGEAEVENEGSRSITTGDASAYAGALTVANVTVGCSTCGLDRPVTNRARVANGADAYADTGDNHQSDGAVMNGWFGGEAEVENEGSRSIRTGSADATSRAWTVVNSQLSWGLR